MRDSVIGSMARGDRCSLVQEQPLLAAGLGLYLAARIPDTSQGADGVDHLHADRLLVLFDDLADPINRATSTSWTAPLPLS